MPYEHKQNEGSLFKNDRKTTENHPDYTGDCNFEGSAYWVNAWINAKEGKKTFLKLTFRAKDTERTAVQNEPPPRADEFDDSIPF